jgi:hypothetical protein
VFAAEKACRQRQAAIAASVGGRSAAAAAMTAAAAQRPQPGGASAPSGQLGPPQKAAGSRKGALLPKEAGREERDGLTWCWSVFLNI